MKYNILAEKGTNHKLNEFSIQQTHPRASNEIKDLNILCGPEAPSGHYLPRWALRPRFILPGFELYINRIARYVRFQRLFLNVILVCFFHVADSGSSLLVIAVYIPLDVPCAYLFIFPLMNICSVSRLSPLQPVVLWALLGTSFGERTRWFPVVIAHRRIAGPWGLCV